jgi:hypothetical protein
LGKPSPAFGRNQRVSSHEDTKITKKSAAEIVPFTFVALRLRVRTKYLSWGILVEPQRPCVSARDNAFSSTHLQHRPRIIWIGTRGALPLEKIRERQKDR